MTVGPVISSLLYINKTFLRIRIVLRSMTFLTHLCLYKSSSHFWILSVTDPTPLTTIKTTSTLNNPSITCFKSFPFCFSFSTTLMSSSTTISMTRHCLSASWTIMMPECFTMIFTLYKIRRFTEQESQFLGDHNGYP